ncbi:MAG TPA: hypothetical protein DG753_10265 [Clostridium sp.]|nr:hypothetical protein [Clostridium sp.]
MKNVYLHKSFFVKETCMNMVDLNDVAEAAAIILTELGHTYATYELCGPENISLADMVAAMKENFGHEIKVKTIQDEELTERLKIAGIGEYRIDGLLKMFKHYNEHGFVGNPNVLTWILGRKLNDLSSFICRELKK